MYTTTTYTTNAIESRGPRAFSEAAPLSPESRARPKSSVQTFAVAVLTFIGQTFAMLMYSAFALVEWVVGMALAVLSVPLLLFGSLAVLGLVLSLVGFLFTGFGSG